MAVPERGQSGGVLLAHLVALGTELGERSVEVAGVEQHQRVEHQPQCAELVLHALVVALAQFAAFARPRAWRPSWRLPWDFMVRR